MPNRKSLVVSTLAVVLLSAVGAAWLVVGTPRSSGAASVPGAIDPTVFARTQDLHGSQLQEALGIPTLLWGYAEDGSITLSAPEGYKHLEDCGEELGAVRVVHGDGNAYCIPGVAASAEASFRASSVIVRISQDRLPGDTELRILAVRSELAFVDDTESAEHDALLLELLKLQEALTPGERSVIEAGYARLAVT